MHRCLQKEKPMGVHIVNKHCNSLIMQSLGTNLIKVGGICHSVTILPILYIYSNNDKNNRKMK